MAGRGLSLTVATPPVLHALLAEAAGKGYPPGVLGVRAQPVWDGSPRFDHDGMPVRVVPCASALAVREALLERQPGRWLVILTDRDDEDLGDGITAHLLGQRVRTPDLWQAVRERFGATRIDHRLVGGTGSRDFALAVLTATPAQGWLPAPGGLLTPDHLYGSLATTHLGFDGTPAGIDASAVLAWAAKPEATSRLRALRALAGPVLVDTALDWLAERCGAVGGAIGPLLHSGQPADVVPLGLVARAVRRTPEGSGPRALLRQRIDVRVSDAILQIWAQVAEERTTVLLYADADIASSVLARADRVLHELEADAYADSSDLLSGGLTERLTKLGEALYAATECAAARAGSHGPDAALADPAGLPPLEAAWERVRAHRLATRPHEHRVPRAHAAVRLARWLGADAGTEPADLAGLVYRQRDIDAWVDRAYSDAWIGVSDPALARGLRSVLRAVRLRRAAHDLEFAGALADSHASERPAPAGVHYLEDLLAETVLPLAKAQPTLVVVADGMSMAIATEIVEDIVRHDGGAWQECTREGEVRRAVGLALLPSLTHVSRASLLSAERAVGDQSQERDGFSRLCKAYGVSGRLFHKQPLESSEGGFALAHDVAGAIDDTGQLRLVTCVLNTIDDALDRSDPGGTEWTAATVKHLRPLLDRARAAGRTVVLTADHGHVIERREGDGQRPVGTMSSNRSRPAAGGVPAGEGEVRVRGPRVLLHDGDAVLAVDERVRYGPLKSGYHGGAAPAEVVVPVCVLAQGDAPAGWRLLPPPAPAWWRESISIGASAQPAKQASAVKQPREAEPSLFDEPPLPDQASAPEPEDLGRAVVASSTFAEQRKRAQRLPVTDEQVANLLRALLSAPAHRLDPDSAASALGVAAVQLILALPGLQRLLNVEQYPVLRRDPDGSTIVLDEDMLRDQFGVNR